jgi:hypothetical protein
MERKSYRQASGGEMPMDKQGGMAGHGLHSSYPSEEVGIAKNEGIATWQEKKRPVTMS